MISRTEAWSDASTGSHIVYSLAVTYGGAAIAAVVKNIGIAIASTHEGEQVGAVKVSELLVYDGILERALGITHETDEPKSIFGDNVSNTRVLNQPSSSTRCRYFLIRQTCLSARIANGEMKAIHCPDPLNVVDPISKWTSADKELRAIRFLSGMGPPK